MTEFIVQGLVVAPSGPDNSATAMGYDNGGYFGPQFANLGGLPFSVTWTGIDCNCYGGPANPVSNPLTGAVNTNPVITDAVLMINGASVDLGIYNNISTSEWLDLAGGPFLQLQTTFLFAPFPSGQEIFPGSQYTLDTGANDARQIGGSVYLLDTVHPLQTQMFLDVTSIPSAAVPAPIVGQGMSGVMLLAALIAWWRRRWK